MSINSAARADTRFAVNQVTTSGENRDTSVTITAYVDNRAASVTTNRLDEASLAAAAKQATEIAQPRAAESRADAGTRAAGSIRRRRTARSRCPTRSTRSLAAKKVTEMARAAGLVATGFIECRVGANALANSKGLFAYDSSSSVTMTATVRTPDGTGSGWACSDGDTFDEIDAQHVAATAVEKAKALAEPGGGRAGRYVTILENTAVGNLVQLIVGAMQARSADEGRSFFSKPGGGNKIGMKVVDERVTLLSDPADSPSSGGGYDADGMPGGEGGVDRERRREEPELRPLLGAEAGQGADAFRRRRAGAAGSAAAARSAWSGGTPRCRT